MLGANASVGLDADTCIVTMRPAYRSLAVFTLVARRTLAAAPSSLADTTVFAVTFLHLTCEQYMFLLIFFS
jgi:hypothetical protein